MAEIILKNVRLSFPDLHNPGTPHANSTDKTPKYGAHFLMGKDSEAFKVAMAEFSRVAQEKWGANWQAIVGAIERTKKALRDGNFSLDKAGVVRDGYKDVMFVAAKNKAKPAIVDSKFVDGKPVVLTADSGKPYGGCYVNAKVEFYAMDKPGQGKSINCTLKAVQFVRDGEAFAGGPGTADGFEDEGGDEGEGNAFGEAGAAPAEAAANLF